MLNHITLWSIYLDPENNSFFMEAHLPTPARIELFLVFPEDKAY
jgi:hypothetical protein